MSLFKNLFGNRNKEEKIVVVNEMVDAKTNEEHLNDLEIDKIIEDMENERRQFDEEILKELEEGTLKKLDEEKFELYQKLVNIINTVKEEKVIRLKEKKFKVLEEKRLKELKEEVVIMYDYIEELVINSIENQSLICNTINLENVLADVAIEIGYNKITENEYLGAIKEILEQNQEKFNVESIDFLNKIIKNLLYIENDDFMGFMYYDSSESKYKTCNAIFCGKYIKCKTKDNNYIVISLNQKGLINVYAKQLTGSISDKYNIFLDSECFLVNENDKVKIIDYYTKVNKLIQKEINNDIIMIKQNIENVSQDVIQIILNFLEYFPKSILLDSENYITFEHLISFNNYYSNLIVNINENQRNYVINKIKNDENYFNQIQHVKNENYSKLVKIIEKYISVENGIHSSIVWSLIKKYSIEHFAKIWDKEYGSYFYDLSDKSLNELIYIYCRVGEINVKDINTAGLFTYYLMYNKMFTECDNYNFVQCNILLIDYILKEYENIELEQFENKLNKTAKPKTTYSIDDTDLMNGYEFEYFVGDIFNKMGYSVQVTKGSGDQGIDILIEKDGNKIGVQAKCYSSNVSNKAIQEVVAGLNYYNCYKGIVVTNNFFTESAKALAEANNIILWDRDMLKNKIESVLNKGVN